MESAAFVVVCMHTMQDSPLTMGQILGRVVYSAILIDQLTALQ